MKGGEEELSILSSLGQNFEDLNTLYSVFHRFREAKFGNGGSILSSSQFSLLP